MRTVIAGGPRTGKTTLANAMGVTVDRTDDLVGKMEWSALSEYVADIWMSQPEFCIEGVAAVRALRKWMVKNPEGIPCDEVVWLDDPKEALLKGQASMAKGCVTIWTQILPELEQRGVKITYEQEALERVG